MSQRPICADMDSAFSGADSECRMCRHKDICKSRKAFFQQKKDEAKKSDNAQRGHSRTTYIYCEKAPPREVLEASGLVWSFGLKREYERHVRHFGSYCGNYLIEGTYYLVPDCEFPWSLSTVLPQWLSNGVHVLPQALGYGRWARCKLCGGWIMETNISALNDKRLRPQVELFSTKRERTIFDMKYEMKPGIASFNPEAVKGLQLPVHWVQGKAAMDIPCTGEDCPICRSRNAPGPAIEKALKSREVAKKYKEKLAAKSQAFAEAYGLKSIHEDEQFHAMLEKATAEKQNQSVKDVFKMIEGWKIPNPPALLPKSVFEGPDLDQLRMLDADIRDYKGCVRGRYTFTIEQRPGHGVLMRCTSPSPAGNFLVSEKLITESDMLQPDFSVYGAWKQFVDSIALEKDQPRANGCESKFAHICEGKVQGCWFHNGDGTATKTYHFCARAIELHRDRGNKIYVEPDKEEAEKVGRETSKMFEFPLMYGRLANRNGDIFSDETLKQFREWYIAKKKELGNKAQILPTLEFPLIDYAEMEKKIFASLGLKRETLEGIGETKIEPMGLPEPSENPVCPIRQPQSCRTARQHLSRFVCGSRCPLRNKP